jgi:pimeloyl-ACP methyl ester carboxylesterase
LDQFKYGWANALSDDEAKQLYETYHVAAPGVALIQMATANLNPWTEAKVDTTNPDRGPLLIIDGEQDHTVPWAIAHAAFNRQRHNQGVTELTKIPKRGHSLTIDSGWRHVADTALAFIKRSSRANALLASLNRGRRSTSSTTSGQAHGVGPPFEPEFGRLAGHSTP